MENNKNKLYGRISIYVPKHERNFVNICEQYCKEEYEMPFSGFVLMCIKSFINGLSREEKKKFESKAWKIAQLEKPTITDFVDKFIKHS